MAPGDFAGYDRDDGGDHRGLLGRLSDADGSIGGPPRYDRNRWLLRSIRRSVNRGRDPGSIGEGGGHEPRYSAPCGSAAAGTAAAA